MSNATSLRSSAILLDMVQFMNKEPKEAADRNESDEIIRTDECLLVGGREILYSPVCESLATSFSSFRWYSMVSRVEFKIRFAINTKCKRIT
jgi:hypothetical protein